MFALGSCQLGGSDEFNLLTRKSWRGTSLALRNVLSCGIGNAEKVKWKKRFPGGC